MAVKTGHMSGQTYYSDTMPKGAGDEIAYDRRLFQLSDNIFYDTEDAHPDSVIALQEELIKVGYLDEHNSQSLDAQIGPMTMGAAWRYLQNFGREALWDNISKDVREMFGY